VRGKFSQNGGYRPQCAALSGKCTIGARSSLRANRETKPRFSVLDKSLTRRRCRVNKPTVAAAFFFTVHRSNRRPVARSLSGDLSWLRCSRASFRRCLRIVPDFPRHRLSHFRAIAFVHFRAHLAIGPWQSISHSAFRGFFVNCRNCCVVRFQTRSHSLSSAHAPIHLVQFRLAAVCLRLFMPETSSPRSVCAIRLFASTYRHQGLRVHSTPMASATRHLRYLVHARPLVESTCLRHSPFRFHALNCVQIACSFGACDPSWKSPARPCSRLDPPCTELLGTLAAIRAIRLFASMYRH
jgi:hypothetical protein